MMEERDGVASLEAEDERSTRFEDESTRLELTRDGD